MTNTASIIHEENEKIKKFFTEYYSGFGSFSPEKRKNVGLPLDYSFYYQAESLHRLLYRTLLQDLKLETLNFLKILDVGCGDGNLLRRLLDWGANPSNLFGVDSTHKIIEDAKRLSSSEMSFQQGMGSNLPFTNHYFDLMFCVGVIIHILDDNTIRAMANEFSRILKPTGHLFLVVTNETITYEHPWMSQRARTFNREKNEIENLFAGWTVIKRDDSIFECIESVFELTAQLSQGAHEAEKIRSRSSGSELLLEGTVDHDLSKLLRNFQYGSHSLYLLKPSTAVRSGLAGASPQNRGANPDSPPDTPHRENLSEKSGEVTQEESM